MHLFKLSEKEILKLKEKLSDAQSDYCQKLISEGWGHETFAQMERRAVISNDPLTHKAIQNAYDLRNVVVEIETRKAYHGSLKPIK